MADLITMPGIYESPDIKVKMQILHAVNKSLDRITVAEICERAGVSRQTFYRHFESKYDIPYWYTIFSRQFYLDQIGRTLSWEVGYSQHLALIIKEIEFFHHSLQYSINSPYGQTVLPAHRKKILLSTLQDYRKISPNENMLFLVDHYAKTETEVINEWLRTGEEPNLKRWTDNLVSLVPHRLYLALRIDG